MIYICILRFFASPSSWPAPPVSTRAPRCPAPWRPCRPSTAPWPARWAVIGQVIAILTSDWSRSPPSPSAPPPSTARCCPPPATCGGPWSTSCRRSKIFVWLEKWKNIYIIIIFIKYVIRQVTGPVTLDTANHVMTTTLELAVYWQDFRLIIRLDSM